MGCQGKLMGLDEQIMEAFYFSASPGNHMTCQEWCSILLYEVHIILLVTHNLISSCPFLLSK